jgi:hypothetical protein
MHKDAHYYFKHIHDKYKRTHFIMHNTTNLVQFFHFDMMWDIAAIYVCTTELAGSKWAMS